MVFFFFLLSSLFFPVRAYLPNSAYTIPLSSVIPVGSIIIETADGFAASTGKENEQFVGILVESADFVYELDETTARPVVSSGVVPILLTNENGPIMKGDEITISKTKLGIGSKAQRGDIIVGIVEKSVQIEGETLVPVMITYAGINGSSQSLKDESVFAQEMANLLKTSNQRILDGSTNPALYLLAIIVVIIAAVFGFILFGRISINGITAIGRNPLAKGAIITGMVINSLLVISFMIGTLFAAAYIVGW